jgi:hypothetical protein
MNDGIMDEVHSLRDRFAADIVILIIEYADKSNITGISNIMQDVLPSFESYAFCVVKRNASYQNLIFPHEIGHILGARHQCNDDNIAIPFPFGHGWSNNSFRTIMSTNYVPPGIEYWSDPNIIFPRTGEPTGGIQGDCAANEAECLRQTISTVSKFRCHQHCQGIEDSANLPHPSPPPPPPKESKLIWWILLAVVVIGIVIWLIARNRRN